MNSEQRESSETNESQLDELIARIHGLVGDVGTPARRESSAESPDRVEAGGSNPVSTGAAGPETHGSMPVSGDARASHAAAEPTPADASTSADAETGAAVTPAEAHGSGFVNDTSPARGTGVQIGFQPGRDEPWRPEEPTSFGDLGVPEALVEHIMMRFMLARGESSGRQLASQVKLPFRLIEPILERLKSEQIIAYRRSSAAGDYEYVLTEAGRAMARGMVADCTYFGACPVALDDYIASVSRQTIEGQQTLEPDLHRAFQDLLIDERMLGRLGPAINSGRGMFLYGFPGNGKTSIAERVTSAFGKYVWIPRALVVDGEIMRLFDPMNHELDMPEGHGGWLDQSGYDKRWVRIKRPTIVAGGELTMEMLEVQCNEASNISEAPLQLKSNCGTLVIDDFGRQKMSVDQLLNRWIVPLEKRYDFLNMRSGKKVQVPFDQLVVFSTNLEPKDLVDDAFLRRIPYKIEVPDPSEAHFRELFKIMCRVLKIPYRAEPIDYLIRTHYQPVNRPFRNCQPRDLLLQVRNHCLYRGETIELCNEYFDYAVENYFSIM